MVAPGTNILHQWKLTWNPSPTWTWKSSSKTSILGFHVNFQGYPIGAMYGIFTYISHKFKPNEGNYHSNYTIHGSYGYSSSWKNWGSGWSAVGPEPHNGWSRPQWCTDCLPADSSIGRRRRTWPQNEWDGWMRGESLRFSCQINGCARMCI